jgi:hypothetical protein
VECAGEFERWVIFVTGFDRKSSGKVLILLHNLIVETRMEGRLLIVSAAFNSLSAF